MGFTEGKGRGEEGLEGDDGAEVDDSGAFAAHGHSTGRGVGEGGHADALLRGAAVLHEGDGQLRIGAVGQEFLSDGGQLARGHEEHRRAPEAGLLVPVAGFVQQAVAFKDADLPGQPAVGEGNPRGAGDAVQGAHAGDDFEGYARAPEGQGLLAAPAEKVGIAALEADDLLPSPGLGNQQSVDLVLGEGVVPGPLAHEDRFGLRREELEEGFVQQGVVEDHFSGLEGPQAP